MNNWRRKGDNFNRDMGRTQSNHYRTRPHGGHSNWQQTVPSWEKRFCSSVGSYSWKKFLEAKRFTYLYNDILNWDDSAGKEAFENAKNRFYAKVHDIPCDIKQPEPYLYIDETDWNSKLDENLILDLESDYVDNNHEQVVIFGDAIPDRYKDYSPYGWGDSNENVKKVDENGINWDERFHDKDWNVCYENAWWVTNKSDEKDKAKGDQGWNMYENGNKWRFNGDENRRSRPWRNKKISNNNNNNNGNWRKSTGQGRGNRRESVF